MATDSPSRSLDRFVFRLPDGMRERLSDAALRNGRSMNAELIAILDKALSRPEGLLLQQTEQEYRAIQQQIADSEMVLNEARARLASVEERLVALRSDASHFAEAEPKPFLVKPRPRPKGQFVPTRRD